MLEDIRRQICQGLIGFHQVKIDLRFDLEEGEHLIEHLTVLGRNTHGKIHFLVFVQLHDHRSKFDCFGACAQDGQNLYFFTFLRGSNAQLGHFEPGLLPCGLIQSVHSIDNQAGFSLRGNLFRIKHLELGM